MGETHHRVLNIRVDPLTIARYPDLPASIGQYSITQAARQSLHRIIDRTLHRDQNVDQRR